MPMKDKQYIEDAKDMITRNEVDDINIKYVDNTDNMYAVTRSGAVYSFTNKMRGKRIGSNGPNGYLTAYMKFDDGKQKVEYIHRLVANAFIPNPDGKSQIDHIDEDKTNNSADNLKWATSKENVNGVDHAEELIELLKENTKNRSKFFNKTPKRVAIINKKGNIVEISPSINAAAAWIAKAVNKSENSSEVQISNILQEKYGFKTCGGYNVREASEEEYKAWIEHIMKKLDKEETIDTDSIDVKKLNKKNSIKVKKSSKKNSIKVKKSSENNIIDVKKLIENNIITVINRRMDVESGEVEVEVSTFDEGEKIKSELK